MHFVLLYLYTRSQASLQLWIATSSRVPCGAAVECWTGNREVPGSNLPYFPPPPCGELYLPG